MKIIGKKVITLTDDEKAALTRAARILENLADQVEPMDEEFVMELNRAYDTCMDTAYHGTFEYNFDDGNE
jgi:DNA-binding SARP family transcriptional activator